MTQSPASPTKKRSRTRRTLWWVTATLLIGLLMIPPLQTGLATFRAYRTLHQLSRQIRSVDTPSSLTRAQPLVKTLRADLARLRHALTPMMPVLRQLAFVPRYGALLASADQLAAAGEQATAIVDQGLSIVQETAHEGANSLAWIEWGPLLAPLAGDLRALETALTQLPLTDEAGALGRGFANLRGVAALATIATELGPTWPQLLGGTRPTTYLVLVQNNHELRATGGFISALAPVTLVNGQMQPVNFVDSYSIYSSDLAYPPAPAPMRTYMDIELLTLRDANWSPHLPSDATVIRTLYQQQTGLAVDGVITVDLDAVAFVLPAFQNLTLPDSEVVITRDNVEEALVQLWNNPLNSTAVTSATGEGDWWGQRKDFIAQLTSTLFQRMQQRAVDPVALAGGIVEGLDRRAVQVWLFNTDAQSPLSARGWDGGLHPQAKADYVALVDTNVGYNKANAVVTRAVDYHVTWPDDPTFAAEATLTITYTHPVDRTDPVCRPVSYYGTRYEEMIARCLFNYSRIYVPAGSELLSVEGWLDATVTSERAEQNTQQFAGYFVQNPGTQHQVTLHYKLPTTLRPQEYQLVVQRQAGTDPMPLRLQQGDREIDLTLTHGQFIWSP